MVYLGWVVLTASWCAWASPFFWAPRGQKRPSVTDAWSTRSGLFLECLAIFLAFAFRTPASESPGFWRLAAMIFCGLVASVLSWSAVHHLGRQFRVSAGLYEDHELVTGGPYSFVRHPIYTSILAILGCTLLLLTPWKWALISLLLFVVGTEIRVRAEDRLLASRFGRLFANYHRNVRAYVPFVR
jgi:protein-S-isoprenylcysteine O-methyltransferase Ste14